MLNCGPIRRNLPYDAEVEYIAFTGTQWIDTGVVPPVAGNSRPILEVSGRIELAAFSTSSGALFGCSMVTPRLNAQVQSSTIVGIGGGTGIRNTTISPALAVNTPFDFRFRFPSTGNRTFWIDGTQYDGGSGQPGPTTATLYLIGSRRGPGSGEDYGTYLPSGKLYSAVVKTGTAYNAIRNFIPVRVGQIGALYDKLGSGGMNPDGTPREDGLYFSRGTAFTPGPDIRRVYPENPAPCSAMYSVEQLKSPDRSIEQYYAEASQLETFENFDEAVSDFAVGLEPREETPPALRTYESVLRRFRPVYIPTVAELFDKNTDVETVAGWSNIPHTWDEKGAFGAGRVIIPTNAMSGNSPRSDKFNSIDRDLLEEVSDADELRRYDSRDWLFPLSAIAGVSPTENRRIIPNGNFEQPVGFTGDGYNYKEVSFPDNECQHVLDDRTDGFNSWTYSPRVGMTERQIGDGNGNLRFFGNAGATVSADELESFDDMTPVSDELSIPGVANWLYLALPRTIYDESGGGGGSREIPPYLYLTGLTPFLYWKSAKGWNYPWPADLSPGNWCYGLGHPHVNIGSSIPLSVQDHTPCSVLKHPTVNDIRHQNGFSDDSMRMHAVSAVAWNEPTFDFTLKDLQDPSKSVNLLPQNVDKGYYDPTLWNTAQKWPTPEEGNEKYGIPNALFPPDQLELTSDLDKFIITSVTSRADAAYNDSKYRDPYIESSQDDDIRPYISGKHMAWSLWNVVRHGLYAKNPAFSDEVIESMTKKFIVRIYNDWYSRFVVSYQGETMYSSVAEQQGIIEADTAWVYWNRSDPVSPKTYIEAQTFANNGRNMWKARKDSEPWNENCYVEWSNILVSLTIAQKPKSNEWLPYKRVYTGAFDYGRDFEAWVSPYNFRTKQYSDPANSRSFPELSGVRRESIDIPQEWEDRRPDLNNHIYGTGAHGTEIGTRDFSPTLKKVDRCRLFELYAGGNGIYQDYTWAWDPYEQLGLSVPESLSTSAGDVKTVDVVKVGKTLVVRRLIPAYVDWASLNSNGTPISPAAFSSGQADESLLKALVFHIVPFYATWSNRQFCGDKFIVNDEESLFSVDGIILG